MVLTETRVFLKILVGKHYLKPKMMIEIQDLDGVQGKMSSVGRPTLKKTQKTLP